MRNSLDNQKTISLNKGVLTHSKVTPAKKSGGLGTITKSCSTLTRQGLQPAHDSEKIKAYRKFTIKLKERAGEILFNQRIRNKTVFAGAVNGELIKKCRLAFSSMLQRV